VFYVSNKTGGGVTINFGATYTVINTDGSAVTSGTKVIANGSTHLFVVTGNGSGDFDVSYLGSLNGSQLS
jgi:hypothetical protein